jgi:hypothetical protein
MALKYSLYIIGESGGVPVVSFPIFPPCQIPMRVIGDGTSTVIVVPLKDEPIGLNVNKGKLPTGTFVDSVNSQPSSSLNTSTWEVTLTFSTAPSSGSSNTFVLNFTYDGV